jgi:hypothetical protein
MGKYSATVEDHLILPARAMQTPGQERVYGLLRRPVPPPVLVRLLIDTGSKRSTLIPGVVRHLSLGPAGSVRIETSLANVEAGLFWVRLEFPDSSLASIPEFAVARISLPPSLAVYHGIVGRDLLRRWESLFFEGRRGRFTLRDTPAGLRAWFGR